MRQKVFLWKKRKKQNLKTIGYGSTDTATVYYPDMAVCSSDLKLYASSDGTEIGFLPTSRNVQEYLFNDTYLVVRAALKEPSKLNFFNRQPRTSAQIIFADNDFWLGKETDGESLAYKLAKMITSNNVTHAYLSDIVSGSWSKNHLITISTQAPPKYRYESAKKSLDVIVVF